MIFQISDTELKWLTMLATGRHFIKDIVIPDRDIQRWANTQHEADLLGVIGEYYVAKYLDIPFDTSINLNGDGGKYDLYFKEYSIQVKATKYKTGRLVFNSLDELSANVYALAVIDLDALTCYVPGIISKKNILKNYYTQDLGHGIRYCIDQNNLKSIDLLINQ